MDQMKATKTPIQLTVSVLAALTLGTSLPAICHTAQDPSPNETKANKSLDEIEISIEKLDKNRLSALMSGRLQQIIASQPSNYRAHLILGRCYEKLALPKLAAEQYAIAAKYEPNDPKIVAQLIESLLRSGEPKAAEYFLIPASKKFPKDPQIVRLLGNYYFYQGKLEDANRNYQFILNTTEQTPQLLQQLAMLRLSQNNLPGAVHYATLALKQTPSDPKSNFILGSALYQAGHYEAAVHPLGIAFKVRPALVAQNYARCLYWSGHYQDAVEPALVNLAVASNLNYNPDSQKDLLFQILTYVSKQKTEATIAEVSNNIDRGGHNPVFHSALGDVLERLGRHNEALAQYQIAAKLNPNDPRTWFYIGSELEFYQRDYEGALDAYRKAHALVPSSLQVSMCLNRLEDRLLVRQDDLSWQVKDWFTKNF
jgi:Flp pilus assembly protein TadD